MNICIICKRYPHKNSQVHVFVMKLVNEWARKGNKCFVIAPLPLTSMILGKEKYAPFYEENIIDEENVVKIYRPKYIDFGSMSINGIGLSLYYCNKAIQKTISNLQIKFDFVYTHFFEMALSAWETTCLHNLPLFVATGESVIPRLKKPCAGFEQALLKEKLCGAICVSSKNQKEACKLGLIDLNKSKVFPNGTNLSLFKPSDKISVREDLGIDKDAFVIICVGQFLERKGQSRILKAIDKIPQISAKLIFIGKGPVELSHPNIIYKGVVENNLIPKYLNASDLFVLPTLHEGCCNAIIEALACGLPIVSSNLSFNYDVLDSSNSILIDPSDTDQIAEAIYQLWSNRLMREKLSEGALRKAQELSISERSSNILSFIEKQLGQ